MQKKSSVKKILKNFSDQKTVPVVAIKITRLVNSPDSTIRDFEEIIKLDPMLVTRLLRYVNSPMFALASKVESISKAVIMVGMNQVRNLVSVETVKKIFRAKSTDNEFCKESLWVHSATVGIISKMISQRIFGENGEDAFLTGILHDIGMIAEEQTEHALFIEAVSKCKKSSERFTECEQEYIGTDHTEVGSALCSEWNLKNDIINAIKNHHDILKEHPLSSPTSILQLSDYVACRIKYAYIEGKVDSLPIYLAQHMKDLATDYKILVRDIPSEIEKARELYDLN